MTTNIAKKFWIFRKESEWKADETYGYFMFNKDKQP